MKNNATVQMGRQEVNCGAASRQVFPHFRFRLVQMNRQKRQLGNPPHSLRDSCMKYGTDSNMFGVFLMSDQIVASTRIQSCGVWGLLLFPLLDSFFFL